MPQIDPSDSQGPDSRTDNTGQMVSHEKVRSLSSNLPLHKRILVVDDNSYHPILTLRIGWYNSATLICLTKSSHSKIFRYCNN